MPADNVKRKFHAEKQLEDGATYEGEWDEAGNKSGRGVQVQPGKFIYEGYWEENKASIYGRLITAKGNVYCGQWQDGKFHGYGKFERANGKTYTGYWH